MIERLSTWSRACLTTQGYGSLSDEERRSLWLGLRFSPALCFTARPLLGGASVPPSPAPRRFARRLATPWIVAIAVAFLAGLPAVAWILAGPLLLAAATVATTN